MTLRLTPCMHARSAYCPWRVPAVAILWPCRWPKLYLRDRSPAAATFLTNQAGSGTGQHLGHGPDACAIGGEALRMAAAASRSKTRAVDTSGTENTTQACMRAGLRIRGPDSLPSRIDLSWSPWHGEAAGPPEAHMPRQDMIHNNMYQY
eukprot:364243-Chlamydomonas_euryale.AAC.5